MCCGSDFGGKSKVFGSNLGGLGIFLAFFFAIQGVLSAMLTFLGLTWWSWGRLLGDFGVVIGSFVGRWREVLRGFLGGLRGLLGFFHTKDMTYSTVAENIKNP